MEELLFLAHRIPYPPNKGDKIRSWHMFAYLRQHFHVHLGCFIDHPDDRRHIEALRPMCASSCFIEQSPLRARLHSLAGLASPRPMSLHYYRDAVLQEWASKLLQRGRIRHALAYSGPMAQYLFSAAAKRGKAENCVVDFVDVDSEKWQQYAASKPWPLSALYRREARQLLAYETEVARQADAVTFVSMAEAALFRRTAPSLLRNVDHFNNGVDADYFTPHAAYPDPYRSSAPVLVFTGMMDYWPNVQAMTWFVRTVMPLLQQHRPDVQLHIVGARPVPAVQTLAQQPSVHVSGAVADIRPYLAHAALALAPLRIARGVQNKVLEAMAMQKTVIASPQALEGLTAAPGSEVQVAASAQQFVDLIIDALDGNQQLGVAARARVLRDYRWELNLERLGALFDLPRQGGLSLMPKPATRESAA